MPENSDKEILIPEVLPPDRGEPRRPPAWGREPPPREHAQRTRPLDRIANLLGPILSGLILDFSHIQPMRLPGFLIGLFLGYWFARVCSLRASKRVLIAMVAAFIGIYGLHRFVPIATIFGVFFALQNQNSYRERNR
jgi:hypothetical protein